MSDGNALVQSRPNKRNRDDDSEHHKPKNIRKGPPKTVGHGLLRIVGCGARQAADQKGHFRR